MSIYDRNECKDPMKCEIWFQRKTPVFVWFSGNYFKTEDAKKTIINILLAFPVLDLAHARHPLRLD